ncbi:MAG: DUF1573 domain-containing protein [Ignavibacteria bacterium]|jgi:hypothetical protein|nr:DUF1573 domain-containing protein [Ignavibacteria bacterium]
MKNFLNSKSGKISYFVVGLAAIFTIMFFVINNSKLTASLKAPKIVFKEDVHDFGKVPRGPELQYNFKFTNKGNASLVIERVQTSCGCTGATVGDKKEYSKNESGEIKVNFSTQGRDGHQEKTITIFSNDPENPQKTLTIKCEIDANLQQ